MTWFALPNALRTALLASATIADAVGTRLHYQELPQASEFPHIWFQRSGRNRDRCLDDSDELTVERFTLEIVSDSDVESLIDAIVDTLESFEGQYGTQLVQFVEIEDADDDYIFQSVGEGEPDYLHALTIAVYVVPL